MARNASITEEYIFRINEVIDFIEQNLSQELTLDLLAQVAHFSKFHFSRIFYAFVGETLFQFIQRIRLERVSILLSTRPKDSITAIAYDCGFQSSAAFARAFKQYFGVSATEWREGGKSNLGKVVSKNCKERSNKISYTEPNSLFIRKSVMKKLNPKVEVKDLPKMYLAYVRHIGPYAGDAELFKGLYEKILKWAGSRGLLDTQTKYLNIYHDDPKVTEESKLRVSVCVTVPEGTKVDGEIGSMTIPGGKYAIGEFILANDEYPEAWGYMYGQYLSENGYLPDDRVAFEMSGPEDEEYMKKEECRVKICVPIKPA